jgi:hypothetical protein
LNNAAPGDGRTPLPARFTSPFDFATAGRNTGNALNLFATVKLFAATALLGSALLLHAQTTFTDDFANQHNYLTEGVPGTIWDGVYLGANEIVNPMGVGLEAGQTSVALASNGVLTVTSLQTDWENSADDGFFLFKIITGDFDMSVQIAGPIDTRAHNFPGLMVRAFGPGGAPAPDGRENYLIWGRFDEYNIANMLKNETDGLKRDRGLGTFPNTNYWLRIQRLGNVFNFFEKGSAEDVWKQSGSVTRTNFSDSLQAGIEHADYDGGRVLSAGYKHFTLTASSMGPFAAPPSPVKPGRGKESYSWSQPEGNSGILMLAVARPPPSLSQPPAWGSRLEQVPVNGITYQGDPSLAKADKLAATGYYVIYAGPANTNSNPLLQFGNYPQMPTDRGDYHIAVFSYTGTNQSIIYSPTPFEFEYGTHR